MGADLLRDQPAGALPKLAPKQELIEAQSVSRRCGPRFSKRRKQMTYSKILNHGCRIQLIPPLESFETDSPLPLSLRLYALTSATTDPCFLWNSPRRHPAARIRRGRGHC